MILFFSLLNKSYSFIESIITFIYSIILKYSPPPKSPLQNSIIIIIIIIARYTQEMKMCSRKLLLLLWLLSFNWKSSWGVFFASVSSLYVCLYVFFLLLYCITFSVSSNANITSFRCYYLMCARCYEFRLKCYYLIFVWRELLLN